MRAIEETLALITAEGDTDISKRRVLLGLFGAGRGGILISIARAIRNLLNTWEQVPKLEIIVLEKNPSCRFTL